MWHLLFEIVSALLKEYYVKYVQNSREIQTKWGTYITRVTTNSCPLHCYCLFESPHSVSCGATGPFSGLYCEWTVTLDHRENLHLGRLRFLPVHSE